MNRDDKTRDEADRDEMTDAIYPDDLVLRIADIGTTRVRTLVGNDIGPAGICSLALADGSTVHVDYADPQRLISLDPSGDAPVLDLLIGSERARFARTAAPLGDDQAIRLPGIRAPRRDRAASSLPSGGDWARALGVAAALDAVHHDEDELPIVRAVAGLELAGRARDLARARLVDRTEIASVVDRSLDLALGDEIGLGMIAAAGEKLGFEVGRMLLAAADTAAYVGDERVGRLRRSLKRPPRASVAPDPVDPWRFDEVGRVAAMRASSASLRTFDSDLRDRRGPVRGTTPDLVMTSPGRLRIEWTVRPPGEWVRVLRAGSQVLLALAPIVSDDDGVWAETVVPPDLGIDDLELDTIAGDGSDDLASRTTAERVRAAVDLGRMAVAAATARRRDARELWRRCAEAWSELGDDRRARRAMAYADGELEVTRRETLTDRVREVVDRP